MRVVDLSLILALSLGPGGLLRPPAALAETISFGCPAWGFCANFQATADLWSEKTGHQVRLYESGRLVDDSLGLFRQILSSGSNEFDILLVDCIWPGMLGKHLLDLKGRVPDHEIDAHFKPLVANYTDAEGRLVALPLFTDAGILYYRKDLLEKYGFAPPTTWQELQTAAERIVVEERKKNPAFVGYVFQGKAYEGLTCNALEWVYSHGGGTIIDEHSGEITINNPRARAALKMAASWIGAIAPPEVLQYAEPEATHHFRSGNALFMRNWLEPWATCNEPDSPVRGKVGVIALPKGGPEGRPTGTIGDMSLAVSRYSSHPDQSVDLVRFLASAAAQRRHAMEYSFSPTILSLYEDRELLEQRPFMDALKTVLLNGVARPSKITGNRYAKVSKKFHDAVHAVLSGKTSPEQALARLEQELQEIRGDGW